MQYTGRENDGTGLYFYRARYYSPALQRFVNEDPLEFEAGDINLYSYVSNSPTNYTDPTGEIIPFLVAVCVRGAFSSVAFDIGSATLAGRKATIDWAGAAQDCLTGGFNKVQKTVQLAKAVSKGKRGAGKLAPDLAAQGPHSVFKRDPQTGKVTRYETYQPQTNAQNPNQWESVKRYDAQGKAHYNKETEKWVPTPHIQGHDIPGGVRPPFPHEIPR